MDTTVNSEQKHYKVLRTELTPNPNALQFVVDGQVIAAGNKSFSSLASAKGDGLGEALFQIEGVENVYMNEDYVTVSKKLSIDWDTITATVTTTIESHLSFYKEGTEDVDLVEKASAEEEVPEDKEFKDLTEAQKIKLINELLDVEIRPFLAGDGGGLSVVSVVDRNVNVFYQGACGSCPSSTAGTMQYIQSLLQERLDPDIVVEAGN